MPSRGWSILVFLLPLATPVARADERPASQGDITFERDVQPIMARFGCNGGACHGKAGGQNNFQLSLLGFDADSDFAP